MNIKELIFGNYENDDLYAPNLVIRYKNKILTYKESKHFCSCGLTRYCMFHYCFPNESEKKKIKNFVKLDNEAKQEDCKQEKKCQ